MTPFLQRGLDWVDDQTGFVSGARRAGAAAVPGGPRWAFVFGAALTALLVLQVLTGALLTLYYVPSAEHANATVEFIQKVVPLGWLVRGVHAYGSTAVIVVLLLHTVQTFVAGAYKGRREALWLSGVLLLVLVLALGYTGYQLPWDQRAHYSAQVAAGVAGSFPIVGDAQSRLLLGGSDIGQATLSRFFALHVAVLPAALALLVLAHLILFRRRGFAGPVRGGEPRAYFPTQFARDTAAFVAAIVVLVALSFASPVLVGPPIDPSDGYVARPEWFFLWTFQILKVLPAFVAGVLLPAAIVIGLACAPFLDRSAARAPRERRGVVAIFVAVLATIAAITGYSLYRDARDPAIAEQNAQALQALGEPFEPRVVGTLADPGPLLALDPAVPGPASTAAPPVFLENCSSCHGRSGKGRGRTGPSLVGITAKPKRRPEDLPHLIRDPRAFGLDDRMPAFPELTDDEIDAIVDWIEGLK